MISGKAEIERACKDRYLAIARYPNRVIQDGVYTLEMVLMLRDMAEKDIYPDGRFSDDECTLWSAFHNFRMKDGSS